MTRLERHRKSARDCQRRIRARARQKSAKTRQRVYRAWYAKNGDRVRRNARRYHHRHKLVRLAKNAAWRAALKREVLAHYGKHRTPLCCWRNCSCADIDVLTLDHIANNGAADRKKGRLGGNMYAYLRHVGFPTGFQTLCMNHQVKKEILRKRKLPLGKRKVHGREIM